MIGGYQYKGSLKLSKKKRNHRLIGKGKTSKNKLSKTKKRRQKKSKNNKNNKNNKRK